VSVDRAEVFKSGRLAASLTRTSNGVSFAYHDDYLHAGGPAVATTLPLTDRPLITVAGAVPPFFAGLLPEGRRLTNLRHAIKTSADDELTLLAAVGADPIGDVQIVPEGTPPTPIEPVVTVTNSFDSIRFSDLLADAGIVDPVGIAGVQDKVSARMLSLPVQRSHERFILKLNPPEFPHVVENEAFFLALARVAGLRTVAAEVIHDVDGRSGLLVTRFDRVHHDGVDLSLAVEDAGQVLGLWPADKYNVTMEEAAIALADLCAARPVAAHDLFRQTVFAWLTGNGDLHAKNISVVRTPSAEWRISPAYDLPSTVPYRDTTFALTVGGKRAGFSRRILLEFAGAIGLRAAAARSVLDRLIEATSGLEERLDEAAWPFDRAVTQRTRKELAFRRRQLLGT
jgi:serine/threonine-protein kinase HipA